MVKESYRPEVHRGREVFYSCLSKVFMEMPSESMFKMLEEVLPCVEGAGGILAFLSSRRTLPIKERLRLDDEVLRAYTRIFCLTDSAATSESVYLSPAHLTMQKQAGQVRYIYEHMKFEPDNISNEPPDHISNELMFMAYLAKATVKALEDGSDEYADKTIKLQAGFLEMHILKWVAELAAMISKFKEAATFYGPLAAFMVEFINNDFGYLTD
jgi:TorA maturation chaperone TorD